jgi:hypothetical protein
MNQLMHEDLAHAYLSRRLASAQQERLAQYVIRLARARRAERRARRAVECVQARVPVVVG